MIAGRTTTLIIVVMISAVVLIGEASGIEENRTIKDPRSQSVDFGVLTKCKDGSQDRFAYPSKGTKASFLKSSIFNPN